MEETMTQQEKWQRLIDLLDEADAIQQSLLGERHPAACYEFHNQLNNIADEFTDFANSEGVEIC
jgi:hypothetical protein